MSAGDQFMDIKLSSNVSRSNQIGVWFNDFFKRVFDIVVSGLILLLTFPLFIIIAIAIKRSSPGPVFYRGTRIGRNGKPFSIIKFRTMDESPQSYAGPRITAHDDERITSIGHWLRDTKLNEFPQFWNVLKGHMSLVGPRPEDPEFAKTWPRTVWNEVLSVRPGITSPASIQYRDEEKLLSNCDVEQMYLMELSPDKMRLDQLYVRYRSFLLDLDTLLWTAMMFLPKIGSYKPPEELLFLGVFSRIIRRFLNWFTIDLITTFVAFGITGLIFRAQAPLNIGQVYAILLTFAYAVLFSGMGVVFGTNRIRWSKANPSDYFDLVPSWILATTIAFFLNLFLGYLPSDLILIGSVFSLFGFIAIRARGMIFTHYLEKSIIIQKKSELMRERVLIIGLGASAQHTAWLFEHLTNFKLFHVVGFVDNDLTMQGMRYFGSNVIGKWDDIPGLVNKHDIGIVVLADYRVDSKGFKQVKEICSSTSAKFIVMPDILASVTHLIRRTSQGSIDSDPIDVKIDSICIDCLAQHIHSSKTGSD
jgi:lipopolysaccharide/colanic/teichoic acid biosynthesis glycosyltransferase